MAHGEVYVAQTTPAHLNHFYRADHGGQRVSRARPSSSPTRRAMPEHGIADDAATRQAKLAVDSRAFPLFTYDPRRGASHRRAPVAPGQPGAARATGRRAPDGTPIDFLTFARTEGRFAPHFAGTGRRRRRSWRPADDRLANWRTLQELAGQASAA